jgi:hypothetical protein
LITTWPIYVFSQYETPGSFGQWSNGLSLRTYIVTDRIRYD